MTNVPNVPGFTTKEVQAYLKMVAYRKEYAKRQEVKEARKAYTQKRYERMKALSQVLKTL